jgi:hypothetical protein
VAGLAQTEQQILDILAAKGIEMAAIYFVQEADRVNAVWHASEDAPGVFLCSVELTAYNESSIRNRFVELVEAMAVHRRQFTRTEDPVERLIAFPCATCERPEADDVRHLLKQGEIALSPGGLPVACCRVQVMGSLESTR